jgi:hypothetical protein
VHAHEKSADSWAASLNLHGIELAACEEEADSRRRSCTIGKSSPPH